MDMTDSYGALFLGSLIAMVFWGMTCVQTVMYFINYESDRRGLKTVVMLMWGSNTIHQAFCIYGLWKTLIPQFGLVPNVTSPAGLNLEDSFTWQVSVTGVIGAFSQGFFTWGIWRMVNKKVFLVVLIPLTVTQLFLAFAFTIAPTTKLLANITPSVKNVSGATNLGPFILILSALYATTDVIIAATMCILLQRGRTGFTGTDRMILRLMTASVSTGTCTAIFALFSLITAAASSSTILFFIGELPLAPLYCNAVLANLNSRRYIANSDTSGSSDREKTTTSFQFNSVLPWMLGDVLDTAEGESISRSRPYVPERIPLANL